MKKYSIKPQNARLAIVILLSFAVLFGVILVSLTNIIVLALGMFSFAVGILYTFGPVPISRTPYGELFSGVVMGFIVIFLAVYIHVSDTSLITVGYRMGKLSIEFDVMELFHLAVFTIPSVLCISNIMLANNICDMEDDIVNSRKTLPIYIGKKKAMLLFTALYVFVYMSMPVPVVAGVLPGYYLIGLLSAFIVFKNIRVFRKHQLKAETFVLSVKNFAVINLTNLIFLIVCIVIKTSNLTGIE
jgi:1,4-dihydroxy-2-naphthoate octaprenyltransferase